MIVSFDVYPDMISNIKTFDKLCDSSDYIDLKEYQLSHFNKEFQKNKWVTKIIYINNKYVCRVIWLMNDNEYLNHYENIINMINCFKQTEWYINYMRYNKLNRIINNI